MANVGFGNFLIPLLGSPDITYPRLNNIRFWLLPPSLIFFILRNFIYSGTEAGWILYLLLISNIFHRDPWIDLTIISPHIVEISSIMGVINFISTILNKIYIKTLYQ